MRLTITIDCDNAAFFCERDGAAVTAHRMAALLELERILAKLGPQLDYGQETSIRDSNGNTVGKAEWTEE